MTREPKLFTPGPTRVPKAVRDRMAEPIVHHRSGTFKEIFKGVQEKLQKVYQTQNPIVLLSASGTGAMEACITSAFSLGDPVLVVNGGKFGERWGKLAAAYGLNPIILEVPWGKAVDVSAVAEQLEKQPKLRGVFIQASETSTGVKHPTEEIAKLVRTRDDCLMVVDAITAMGVFNVSTDTWGLDLVVSGSQKAFMLPPGLATISVSEKARRSIEKGTLPRFYFDLKKELKTLEKFQTAYTPAVSLICGLDTALDMILDEGLENVFSRHATLLHECHKQLKAIGLEPIVKAHCSEACTPVAFPKSSSKTVKDFLTHMKNRYNYYYAGGQDNWSDWVFRIGHMGYFSLDDLNEGIEGIKKGFADLGISTS